MSKDDEVDSSLSERPEHHRPRRLADWLNPTGARKVHSLVDKVYKRKNLEMAWERVKSQPGGGWHRRCKASRHFERALEERLDRLHEELRTDTYQPLAGAAAADPEGGQAGRSFAC